MKKALSFDPISLAQYLSPRESSANSICLIKNELFANVVVAGYCIESKGNHECQKAKGSGDEWP